MSGASSSGLKQPSAFSAIRSTGAKPKSKLCKLSSIRSSPKKQQIVFAPGVINEQVSSSSAVSFAQTSSTNTSRIFSSKNSESSSPAKSSNSSPRRRLQIDEFSRINRNRRSSPSPKGSPRKFQDVRASCVQTYEENIHSDEMGFGFGNSSSNGMNDETAMSFLEFESLYTLEKELTQSRRETIAELDEKCIFGGWFGTRRGVYTELPDPACRNTEFLDKSGINYHPGASSVMELNSSPSISLGTSLIPSEGFSFAPGWALNAEHYYQWQQRGKSTQQVLLDELLFGKVLFVRIISISSPK